MEFSRDNTTYTNIELSRNFTVDVSHADIKDLVLLYNEVSRRMISRYEPFSLVYDQGLLVCSEDGYSGYVLSASADSEFKEDIVISATEERQFILKPLSYTIDLRPFDTDSYLLQPQLYNSNITNIFSRATNQITVGDHRFSAYYDNCQNEYVECDGFKRYGKLIAYNERAYILADKEESHIFLYNNPEIDIASIFKDLGKFIILDNEIYFRTNYGYIVTQDFKVQDIIINGDSVDVLCSTEANPQIFFKLEV